MEMEIDMIKRKMGATYSILKSTHSHLRISEPLLSFLSSSLLLLWKIAFVLSGDEDDSWKNSVYCSRSPDEDGCGENSTAIRPPLLARGFGPHILFYLVLLDCVCMERGLR